MDKKTKKTNAKLNNDNKFDLDLKYGQMREKQVHNMFYNCLLYTSPSPRDGLLSRMPSSA